MAATYKANDIGALVGKFIQPELVNQIVNETDPLMMRLLNDATKFDGQTHTVPVITKIPDTGGSYRGFDTLNTTDEQVLDRAEYEDKELYESITINTLDRLKGMSKMAAIEYVKAKMEMAQRFMGHRFAQQLYSDGTGNSSKDLTGIEAAVDDGTNVPTYANISRASNTWWKGQYTDTSTTLTQAIMDAQIDSVSDDGIMPTVIVTTYDLWSKLGQIVGTSQQTIVNGYEKLAPSFKNGKIKDYGINGGFNAISYRGIPVVPSKYVPATYMYFLNENYLMVKYRDQAGLGRKMLKKGFAATEMIPAQNQDGEVARMHFYGNVVCTRPEKQAVHRGLTV